MKRILFIAKSKKSDDQGEWSGTMYQSFQGLVRAGYEVDYVCALASGVQTFLDKLLVTYWLRIPKMFGKQTRMDETFYTRGLYRNTLKNIDYSNYDVIFVPTHFNIINALPKSCKAKIVHLVDATVDSLFEYYTEFSNLWFHNYWEASYLDKKAFRRSDLLIASSYWCKQNAIKDYGISPDKIAVIEFGANIDAKNIPAMPKQIDGKKRLNIYFSTVNWERKGGDVVLDCCEELIRRGMDVNLHITGIRTESPLSTQLATLNYVENHGFLNKNRPEEYQQMIEIMKQMDIFLFPSRAECSSIALCEANGFGLPCFVYDTGGTANYVVNGENGFMLPLSAKGKDFADTIIKCKNNNTLNQLSEGAVKKYRSHLNWNVWSERVMKEIDKICVKNDYNT